MHIFYSPEISPDYTFLNEQESYHCIKVLRLSKNDIIHVIDGKGGYYIAEITNPNPRQCAFKIIESCKEYGKRNFSIHIAIAPTKNINRFEWFLEKATEIGVDEITPLRCERSERKTLKKERLEKIIISAMKQVGRAYKPKLNIITPIDTFLDTDFSGKGFIAHCEGEEKPLLIDVYVPGENVFILIGPEGDFSPSEIAAAMDKKMTAVALGPDRLRTETAGLVACFTINLMNQVDKA